MIKYISVDVESDGPLQGINSMVCFGAVLVDNKLDKTFYGQTEPVGKDYNPEALAVSGFTREQHEKFQHPKKTMEDFARWIKEVAGDNQVVLISDNNGYDAPWINWYFHKYLGYNPFGWSSRRIGDIWCGFKNNLYYKWKKHRKTKHTHNPVDDAKGNAEAFRELFNQQFNQ